MNKENVAYHAVEFFAFRKNEIISLTGVVAISGCQLDYIWNELQSRIERLTHDLNLEAGRYNFLIWILAWRS
jgi:predicted HTH domain antitoxin